MKNTLTILCAVLLSFYAFAQPQPANPARGGARFKVTGTVQDSRKVLVESCNVIVKDDRDSLTLTGVISNAKGEFTLNLAKGTYNLHISFLGIGALKKKVEVNENINLGMLTLIEDITTLEEVTIVGRLVEREGDKFVMNLVGSPIAIGKNSLEILDNAPGVFVDQDGNISMNGRSGTQVMINDRLMKMDGEQLAAYLRNISAEDIIKVEVVPNPTAEYDAASDAGILHFTIRRSALQGYNGSVNFNYNQGFYARFSPGFNINWRGNKLTLYASNYNGFGKHGGGTSHSEQEFKLSGNTSVSDGTSYGKNRYHGINLGGIYDITDRQDIGFELYLSPQTNSNENINITEMKQYENEVLSIRRINSTGTGSYDYNYINADVSYTNKLDSLGSRIKADFDYTYRKMDGERSSDTDYAELDPMSEIFEPYEERIYRQRNPSDRHMYTVNTRYRHMFSKTTSLNAGAKYSFMDIGEESIYELNDGLGGWSRPENRQDEFNYNENLGAVFASFSSRWKKFAYTLGLRAEAYKMDAYSVTLDEHFITKGFDVFPSVNLNYDLNDKGNSIGANYNMRIRRPRYSQLNPNVIQNSDFDKEEGNPDIKPSYTNTFEFTGTLKYRYSLRIGYFNYRNSYDYVTVADADMPNGTISRQAPIDVTHNFYVSTYLPLQFTQWWRFNINGRVGYKTYEILEMHREGWSAQISGYMQFTLPRDWSVSINGMAYKWDTSGNSTQSGYYTVGSGITKRMLKNKNLSASLSINDIFNFNGHSKYETVSDDLYSFSEYRRQSRSFSVSLRWSFSHGKKFQAKTLEKGETEGSRL